LSAVDVSFSYASAGTSRRGVLSATGAASQPLAALSGVSATLQHGAILGMLGPNGSGKTTLLRLLSGTRRPSAGDVRLDGVSLRSMSRRAVARRIAVVPQETQLAYDYTVLEMVLMGRHPHLGVFQLEGPEDVRVAREALGATGTLHLEPRLFNTLSGGEKQRVVIASALAQAADVLLLDEPTASLDLGYQLEIAALLRRLNRERGVTIGVSTHDLNFAASVCDHLVLLREGRVLAAGPTATTLTAAHVRQLYGVDVDVQPHASGRWIVIPVWRDERAHG
jgi:iron complex transport system ATP-binding protein